MNLEYEIRKRCDRYIVKTECPAPRELGDANCPVNTGLVFELIKTLSRIGYSIGETQIKLHNDRLYFLSAYKEMPTEEQIVKRYQTDEKVLNSRIEYSLPMLSLLSAYHELINKPRAKGGEEVVSESEI